MNNNRKKWPSNECIIDKYLNHYRHSPQSVKMRKSCLNYFFGEKRKKCYGYQDHIFNLNTSILIDYFEWLKNLDLVSITTRKNKWNILTSLLQYTMEYYNAKGYEFIVVIPSKTIDWKGAVHKKKRVRSNADVYADKEDIEKILQYFKDFNFKHYLIFRIFTDTGMRKGTLLDMKIEDVYLKERYFHTKEGKTGEKIYPFKEDLAKLLNIYLNSRKELDVDTNILFLNKFSKPYGLRAFNEILEYARGKLNIKKRITTKTFRKTLNDYRKEMGCHTEDREMLLGHKNNKVNIKNYTRSDIKRHIRIYDRWYPYEDLNI